MLQLPEEKSYWREYYKKSLYPELSEDLEIDVAVVGGGITGLTTAYLLKQAGLSVVVMEKRTIGSGTTCRTTGKVTSQHGLIYSELNKHHGKKASRLYGEANQAAVDRIEKIIKVEKINCDWQRQDNYVYTNAPSQIGKFKHEAAIAAEVGLPATFESVTPLPFDIQAAVKFTGQGQFHSQKYLLGLAQVIHGNGSHVFENSNVTGIRDGSPGYIKTEKAKIIAKHIVIATNVPTMPLLARGGYCILEYPTESYIVAGKPKSTLSGMYISPDKHHYSILPVQKNGQKLLLIGGQGHISGLRLSKENRYRQLAKYAEEHFGITSIQYRWSDRDYLAYDSIPLVGKMYPWSKNLYVASAFRKWGLSNGTAAAMILSDLITGQENKWAAIFESTRVKPILSIPRVITGYARHPFSS